MSLKNLKKFIQEQALRGVNPQSLKEGLVLNGWDEGDVEREIADAYGLKKKIKKTGLIIIVVLILILSVSLLLLFTDLYSSPDINTPNTNNNNNQISLETDDCPSITDGAVKDQCYLKKIETGFSCDGLSSTESFYCNRVLEVYLLSLFDA